MALVVMSTENAGGHVLAVNDNGDAENITALPCNGNHLDDDASNSAVIDTSESDPVPGPIKACCILEEKTVELLDVQDPESEVKTFCNGDALSAETIESHDCDVFETNDNCDASGSSVKVRLKQGSNAVHHLVEHDDNSSSSDVDSAANDVNLEVDLCLEKGNDCGTVVGCDSAKPVGSPCTETTSADDSNSDSQDNPINLIQICIERDSKLASDHSDDDVQRLDDKNMDEEDNSADNPETGTLDADCNTDITAGNDAPFVDEVSATTIDATLAVCTDDVETTQNISSSSRDSSGFGGSEEDAAASSSSSPPQKCNTVSSAAERSTARTSSDLPSSTHAEKTAVVEGCAKAIDSPPTAGTEPNSAAASAPVILHVPPRAQQQRPRMGSYGTPPPMATSDEEAAKQQQQYVVNVHVNPGETFSVCVSDQVQLIQGPATVRMVSNNGPPLPMPMQVPPGHMVQQIIDENGILTNVILSSQPPGIMAQPMMVGYYGGPNGGPVSHMYSSPFGGPPYSPFPPAQYTVHHPHPNGMPPPPRATHMHPMAGAPPPHGPHMDGPPTLLHHCNPNLPHSVMPPMQLNHMPLEGRMQPPPRGKARLARKLYKCKPSAPRSNHPVMPPIHRSTIPTMNNGLSSSRLEPNSESSSSEDQELEEDRRLIREQLSRMLPPKVLEIEERSAVIMLAPPEFNQQEFDLDPADFHYELFLSEHKDAKYNMVYSGDATEITLRDLKPATEYYLKVHALLEDLKGNMAEFVSFKTMCCEPEVPPPPKLHTRTVSTVALKWMSPVANGAKVTSYSLEWDQGRGGADESCFVEVYGGSAHQYKLTKLAPSTCYTFRLAAANSFGRSEFSSPVSYSTTGTVPSQPDPPMLSERFVSALTVSWIRRTGDNVFILDMEDEATGNGFVRMYSGPELSYPVSNLQRNTEYKFRLQASNDEGASQWSDVIRYRTLCDRPRPPPRPQVKGKVHPHSFRIVWDPPKDTGGIEISHYLVQMDSGSGFEVVHTGSGREFQPENLQPGRTYSLRVACTAADKQSDWSERLSVTTQCVPPGICPPVCLQGHAHPTSLHVRWGGPEFSGGSSAIEYELSMTCPDREVTSEVYRGPATETVVHNLMPGRQYLFQVRALNHAGAGPWSELSEIRSGANVPDAPSMPTIVCKSPHVAQISWSEPPGNGAPITEYRLEWQHRMDSEFSPLYCGMSLTAEISGLSPATLYSFRVQAVNTAGAGQCSPPASCVTPPSSPAPVTAVQVSPMATSVQVSWRPPADNGNRITAYHIVVEERPPIVVDGDTLEYTVDELQPETTYRIRVQAVNAIGHSPLSTPVKVTTRSLPPPPPAIECIAFGWNSLKLRWRDSKFLDLTQYCLEMQRSDGSFQCIYRGTGHSHKVIKLTELTQYAFRIFASNDAGSGDYSGIFHFSTSKSPPATVKAPKVASITVDSCVVEWLPLKPMSDDVIVYVLQMCSVHESTYRQMYRGSNCTFRLSGLSPSTEYRVRVNAVRLQQAIDSAGAAGSVPTAGPGPGPTAQGPDLIGTPSFATSFVTLPQRSSRSSMTIGMTTGRSAAAATGTSAPRWTDQQWALLLLFSFTLVALLVAYLTQQVISYATSGGGGGGTGGDQDVDAFATSEDGSLLDVDTVGDYLNH